MNDELKVIRNFIKSVKGWAMAYGMTTIACHATSTLDAFNRLEASLIKINKMLDKYEKAIGENNE